MLHTKPPFSSLHSFTSNSHPYDLTMDSHLVPHGYKRCSSDSNELEGAPRAKRRFDRVSTKLGNLSLSSCDVYSPTSESSSDEEVVMLDEMSPDSSVGQVESLPSLIEEPEEENEENGEGRQLSLSSELSSYLSKAKESDVILNKLASTCRVSPGAVTLWRPPAPLPNPLDDASMRGRINEVTDEDVIDSDGDVVLDFDLAESLSGPRVTYPEEEQVDSSSIDSSTLSNSPPAIVETSNSSPLSVSSSDDLMELD